MLRRIFQLLLLAMVAFQSPAARACEMGTLMFGANCHSSPANEIERQRVHNGDARAEEAPDVGDDGPVCQSCQIRPPAMQQSGRDSIPPFDFPPTQLLTLLTPDPASRTFRPYPQSISAASPSVGRVLPLLI